MHVDAYRLADAAEADDLDIDFDGSVVVAEWGAGLIGERGSWIEIVIERPSGADAAETAGRGTDIDSDDTDFTDTDTDTDLEDAAPVEPRTLTLTGGGERWRAISGALRGLR